jgi:phosphoglycerate dehydrogenase-like enzyme
VIHGNPWEVHRDDRCSLPAVLNKETCSFAAGRKIALIETRAVVINTSRGSAVNVRAPFRCLQGKAIAGAGFDVLEEEPAVPTNRLLKSGSCGGHAARAAGYR